MKSFDGRPPVPSYVCKRCGLPGDKKFDGHVDESACIVALRSALRHHHVQLELAQRTTQPVRPPVRGIDRSVLPIYLRRKL